MIPSGRKIRAGLGGPNSTATHVAIEVNGSVIPTFNKPINQHHAITIFQSPLKFQTVIK